MLSASFLLIKILLLPEDPSQILFLPQTLPFFPQPVLLQYLHLILLCGRAVHMSVFPTRVQRIEGRGLVLFMVCSQLVAWNVARDKYLF